MKELLGAGRSRRRVLVMGLQVPADGPPADDRQGSSVCAPKAGLAALKKIMTDYDFKTDYDSIVRLPRNCNGNVDKFVGSPF